MKAPVNATVINGKVSTGGAVTSGYRLSSGAALASGARVLSKLVGWKSLGIPNKFFHYRSWHYLQTRRSNLGGSYPDAAGREHSNSDFGAQSFAKGCRLVLRFLDSSCSSYRMRCIGNTISPARKYTLSFFRKFRDAYISLGRKYILRSLPRRIRMTDIMKHSFKSRQFIK